jgi:hypothetical protein
MGGIDKKLERGQTVRVEVLDSGIAIITVLPAHEDGLKVVEVGCDYVVINDSSAATKTRIPVHCIKTIITAEAQAQNAA